MECSTLISERLLSFFHPPFRRVGSDGSGVQLYSLVRLDVVPRGTVKPEHAARLHKTAPNID